MNSVLNFRNLVLGAAALPMAVKALAVEKPSLFTYRKLSEWRPASRKDIARLNPAWDKAPYQVCFSGSDELYQAILRHVAETDPYAGIVMRRDDNPLRYSL